MQGMVLPQQIIIYKVQFLGQKSVVKLSRVRFAPQTFLVQDQTSNLDQKCAYELFENGPELQFGKLPSISKRNRVISYQIAILVHFKTV